MVAMPKTAPSPEAPLQSAKALIRQHHLSLALIVGGVTLALVLGIWGLYNRQRAALIWSMSTQGEQLQLALNSTLDGVRQHTMGMRLSAERNLRQPLFNDASLAERLERRNLAPLRDAPWDRMPQDLAKDMGSVHVDPSAGSDYRRELNAPLGALAQVVATHKHQQSLVWSYFYDAQKRWRWVYPAQSRAETFAATGKADMGAALPVFWDGAGTTPIEAAGPARNPQKDALWTPVHTDPVKKINVISALAPVYSGETYMGVMGADLALDALGTVLLQRPLVIGHAWVVDQEGRVLASSDTKAAAAPPGPYAKDAGWLRFELRGSPFSLVIYAPAGVVASRALERLLPTLLAGVLGVLALAATAVWLSRKFTLPALQLADYVQNTGGSNIKRPPKVPALRKPWFDSAARAAVDRGRSGRRRARRPSRMDDHGGCRARARRGHVTFPKLTGDLAPGAVVDAQLRYVDSPDVDGFAALVAGGIWAGTIAPRPTAGELRVTAAGLAP